MLKLCCVTNYETHSDAPVVNGHKTREMIIKEAKDFAPSDVARLSRALNRCSKLVKDVYRINSVVDAAEEYCATLAALNSDNVEAMLTADRRFRSYALEFDMFLDYWESSIAHYKRIDETTDEVVVTNYRSLFRNLTCAAYDKHVEYQLMDIIRNQTAHVQSPVDRICIGVSGNEVFSYRDVLLSKCKCGANKKRILQAQEEEIALSTLVEVTARCLQDLHACLIDYQIDDLVIEELKHIEGFIGYAASKNMLYNAWLIIDDEIMLPFMQHIKDMKAYGYLLERLDAKGDVACPAS